MKDELYFREIVAKNLIRYRKAYGMTQLDLAIRLNYSDKAISKWERAESVPDLYTLSLIAEIYHISIDDLLEEDNKKIIPYKKIKITRWLITALSVMLVWLVATIAYIVLRIVNTEFPAYFVYIFAIPVSFIVFTVFATMWFNNVIRAIANSGIVWGLCVSAFLLFERYDIFNARFLTFIIGIPLQALIILWYLLWHNKKQKEKEDEIKTK